ncbi:rhomboid family intramembrane serine protease [Kineosporia sp. A_224]|uniref:rhomboid family intramembrane serine protease n=1 Tax=Kineosporia sp. A_224 TaxID=1962180 RepID=UPI000B4A5C1C|nr:rhomboid family intramembrane serine protease [Kineosporia sp. A_224]
MSAVPGDAPQAGQDAVPVCPRHPRREAYVRCQRCERPVCPECQRPAAVGIQCVDCVKEGAKSIRGARTVLGGRAGQERPIVTQSIIGICAGLFVLQWVTGGLVTDNLSFWPPVALSEPWRFVTAGFLHSTSFLLHIAFNMYILWMIGPYLENILGRLRFTALYLLSAIGGNVGYFLMVRPGGFDSSWNTSTLGASGAVFGLFAALFVVNRRLGRDSSGVVAIVVLNLVLGFLPLLGINIFGVGIAWQAHLGGLATGALVAFALVSTPRERQKVLHPVAFAAVLLLLVALVLVKAATVPAGLLV